MTAARIVAALARLGGLALTLLAFAPAYAAGAGWEAVRAGWRAGRRDVKWLTGEGE